MMSGSFFGALPKAGRRLQRHGFLGSPARMAQSIVLVAFGVALLVAHAGCAKKGPEQRFELKGKIVSVNAKSRQVIVAHQAIPGYMEAMTMPYELKDDFALKVAKPGDQITAELIVSGGIAWLENPVIVAQTINPNQLDDKNLVRLPEPGEQVPDFSLVNQDGIKVRTGDFRGGPLVLTFIYTRCPLPNYCPLMTGNFAELDKDLRKDSRLSSKTHLISITIDPDFDTPSVMRRYGAEYTAQAGDAGFDRWQFATGSPDEIKAIAKYFGLAYWQENGQITHSLVTAVLDPEGKVVKVMAGNDWKPADVLSVLREIKVD